MCINQSDARERSVQVAMMGEVFEKGSELIIWLGRDDSPDQCLSHWKLEAIWDIEQYPGLDESGQRLGLDLDCLYDFGNPRLPAELRQNTEQSHHKPKPRMWRTKYLPDSTMDATISRDLDLLRSQFQPVVARHACWSRLCIVQEVLKCSQRQIWFERSQISWTDLRRLREYFIMISPRTWDDWHYEPMAGLLILTHEHTGYQNIANLWMAFHQNKCSDPRDVIFALQTLVEPCYRCAPDYTKSTEVVFIDAVTAWLTPISTRPSFLNSGYIWTWMEIVATRMGLCARRILLDEQSSSLTNVLKHVFESRSRYLRSDAREMMSALEYWQSLVLKVQIERVENIMTSERIKTCFEEAERISLLRELFQVVFLGSRPDRFADYIGKTTVITDADYSVIFELVKEEQSGRRRCVI